MTNFPSTTHSNLIKKRFTLILCNLASAEAAEVAVDDPMFSLWIRDGGLGVVAETNGIARVLLLARFALVV